MTRLALVMIARDEGPRIARALESGNFGQSIRVRNETTKETFNTVITGPQQTSLTASPAAISE